MKVPDLFLYIKSLSKADKRFFRIFSDAVGGKNGKSYLELFQVMEPMENYDEGEIKAALEGRTFVGHLSTTRNRLFEGLLRSQRVLKAGRSVESEIRSLMEDLELLWERGLQRSVEKKLDKAWRLAEQFEKWEMLLELCHWKWRLLLKVSTSQQGQEVEALISLEEKLKGLQRKQSEMHQLFQRARLLARQAPRARTTEAVARYDALLGASGMKSAPEPELFLCNVYHLMVQGICALGTGRFTEASGHFRNLIPLWENSPFQIRAYSNLYLQWNNDYLTALLFEGKEWDEFFGAITKLQAISGLPRGTQANLQWIGYNQSLIFSMNFKPQGETVALIEEIQPWLYKNRQVLSSRHQLGFFYNFAVFFFCLGEWSRANFWVNQILNENQGTERQDIRDFARVIQVVLQHELKNFDLNEYLVRSAYRYMSRNKKYHVFEKAILGYIRSASHAPSEAKRKAALADLLAALEAMENEYGPKALLGLQEIMIWTHAKIEGLSMQAMLDRLIGNNRDETLEQNEEE